MKKLFSQFVYAFVIAASAFSAQAQALKVSTGGKDGTYSKIFTSLANSCSTQMQLVEVNSTGSTQNIDRLVGNEVNGAFVQNDALSYRGATEDLTNIKTLIALHPESVHVVALAESKEKAGGTLGIGAKPVVLTNINDLTGRVVAAAGGSFITAQVIRLQSEINYQVMETKTAEEALAAVASGASAAAILVGGAPLGQVATLDKNFKLLNFPESTITKLKGVYKPSKVSYPKMGSTGVATIATDALFVTRDYKTPKYVVGMSKLRACFLQAIPELAETTGQHPAFSRIDVSNHGKWPWMEFPVVK